MRTLTVVTFALLAVLAAACSSDSHPLRGAWNQVLPADAKGFTLEFDPKGNAVEIHLPPRPDGSHGHGKGTYTYDAAKNTLVVTAALVQGKDSATWNGTVAGDRIELASGTEKLSFQRGEKAYGH